jgi:AraC-like DNA-binding protein
VTETIEVSEGIRIAWACDTVNVYQRVVGIALEGDPTRVEAIVEQLQRDLPQPANRAESIHVLQSLTLFLDRVSLVLHARFHARFPSVDCGAAPSTAPPGDGVHLDMPVTELPARWAAEYAAWFSLNHRLPAALRTKQRLEEAFAEPLTIPQVAEAVGSSRTTLIDQFTAAFGMPPAEYLGRVRIREGLRRLRQRNDTVERVAAEVGYRSSNKFYARMGPYTDLTPSEVRAMPPMEFEQWLDDRISLRPTAGAQTAGCRRGSGDSPTAA